MGRDEEGEKSPEEEDGHREGTKKEKGEPRGCRFTSTSSRRGKRNTPPFVSLYLFSSPFYPCSVFLLFPSPSHSYNLSPDCLSLATMKERTRPLCLASNNFFPRLIVVFLPFADVIVRLLVSVPPSTGFCHRFFHHTSLSFSIFIHLISTFINFSFLFLSIFCFFISLSLSFSLPFSLPFSVLFFKVSSFLSRNARSGPKQNFLTFFAHPP